MKSITLLFLFVVSITCSAKTLQCSANGTDVYYINGVLTKESKNTFDKDQIQLLFLGKNNLLDSNASVNFIGIHNPSFGIINDAAELFSQAYFIKTGSDVNAKAIYNVIKNTPDATAKDKSKYDPSGFFNAINFFGLGGNINYSTLIQVAEESDQEAIKRSAASVDTLLTENFILTGNIATYIKESKDLKRKILFVAHSQGNAALSAGIISRGLNQPDQVDYMSKYMGVYHVASPVPPLGLPYKSRDIRSLDDKIILAASMIPGYPLPVASITHRVTSRTNSDISGHLFYDTYISPNVNVVPIDSSNATPVTMRDNFVTTLSDLATDLDDNCSIPNIQLSSTEVDSPISGSTNWIVKGSYDGSGLLAFGASDLNDTDALKTTRFFWANLNADAMVASGDLNTPIFNSEVEYKSSDIIPILVPDSRLGYQKIQVRAVNKYLKESTVTIQIVFPDIYPDIDINVSGATKNSADPTVFDYQGYTNFNNTVSITAIDKNESRNLTQFKFDYNYIFNKTSSSWFLKSQQGVSTISDFQIPFSLLSYWLQVTATNKFGKSIKKVFHVAVPNDQPLTAALVSKTCQPVVDSYGNTRPGYIARFLVTDPDNSNVGVSLGVPDSNGSNVIGGVSMIGTATAGYNYELSSIDLWGDRDYVFSSGGTSVSILVPISPCNVPYP